MAVATGCVVPEDLPQEFVVTFDDEGDPVRPREGIWRFADPFERMDRGEFQDHVDGMLEAMLTRAPRNESGERRVLIFVHGGLNTLAYSSGRATEQH